MSDGDWRATAAYLSLGIIAVVVFSWLSWDLSSDLTEKRIREEQSTQSHITYAEDRIDEECLSLQSVALRDCIHEQIESARDHGRAEQDLDAQQDMALFTKIMGITAIIGLALGIGSVGLIFFTLRATQKMAVDTQRIGEAQTRGYLSSDTFNSMQIRPEDKTTEVIYQPVFRNTGASPVYVRGSISKAIVARKGVGVQVNAPEDINTVPFEIPAGQVRHFSCSPLTYGEILDADSAPDKEVLIVVRLRYFDVFSDKDRFAETCVAVVYLNKLTDDGSGELTSADWSYRSAFRFGPKPECDD